MNIDRCFLLGWSLLFAAAGASAQAPTPVVTLPVHSPAVDASSENSRLRQMESIYQQQLRSLHIPLLGKYLTTLQRLAAQALAPLPYQQEIERVQAIISGGGVVDLNAAVQSLRAPAEMPMPTPMPPPKKLKALIALTPALARSISPLPASSASPGAAGVGEIDWRIELLPAGTYEFVMHYSYLDPQEPLACELQFAGQKINFTLDVADSTSKGAFRLLRIGQITLDQEVKGENLRLLAGTKETKILRLRELVITRGKPNP
ncbi:MAG: hypothetical protein U0984_03570 [Prosthecobacter sp.]|nr:hypothetical protein [Prosthecobacter sp.]